MTVIFDNDKISFFEWDIDDRMETMDAVMTTLGTSYAYDSFLAALRTRSKELGIDLENVDWFEEGVFEATDAVYVNAGESVSDALFELSVMTYLITHMSWDDSIADVLSQVREK